MWVPGPPQIAVLFCLAFPLFFRKTLVPLTVDRSQRGWYEARARDVGCAISPVLASLLYPPPHFSLSPREFQ